MPSSLNGISGRWCASGWRKLELTLTSITSFFDCPPATKIVSQNAIAASHGYIIPIVPEAVMERGAPHLVNMVKNGIDKRLTALAAMGGTPRGMYVPDTKLTGLAITRIQTSGPAHSGYINDHTQHLSSLKRTWGNHLESPTLRREQGFHKPSRRAFPFMNVLTRRTLAEEILTGCIGDSPML